MSFEHHAPLFHSLTSTGARADDDSRSGSSGADEGAASIVLSTNSSDITGSTASLATGVSKKSSATTAPSLILPTQPTVFSTTTAAGQLVQYVALPSSSQSNPNSGVDAAAGQQKFILQPVIVPGAQAVMSPLIFPTILKMNAAPAASVSSTFNVNGGN